MFRHPKYYKELRERNKEIGKAQPCVREAAPISNSDQAISDTSSTEASERASDPGLKLQAASHKHQASSFKRQAFEPTSGFKRQATSIPARVTSVKLQATSSKLPDPVTMVHGYWRSIRGTRTEGLYHDKCIVRMACVEGNLVWTKSNFFTFRYLEFYSTKVPRSIIDQ